MVDALGGVAMYFPRPVRDDNNGRNESGLNVPKPGCHRLGGDQALALARSRYFQYQDKAGRWHADPGTDLGRIRRQQTMLRALAAKAIGRNLANPLRANALVGSVVRSLTKDDRLTIRRSVTLARQFRSFDPSPPDHHHPAGRPGRPARRGRPPRRPARLRRRAAAGLGADPAPQAARRRRRRGQAPQEPHPPGPPRPGHHRPPPPTAPAPAKVSVTVKNGTPRQGLAARATAALRRLGFKATNGGNATPSARTTLLHARDRTPPPRSSPGR